MLDQVADLDRVFHALSDPGRRAMLERLSQAPATVSELGRPLDMTLAAVVQHVQVLEASGLIHSQKIGRYRTCRIRVDTLRSAEYWLSQHRAQWQRKLDKLGEYLTQDNGLQSRSEAPDVQRRRSTKPRQKGNSDG